MPELPEIETIRRDLESVLSGDRVASLEVRDRRLLSKKQESLWRRKVPGKAWSSFERRGKYLIVALEDGHRIVFHMRMTGQLVMDGTARFRMAFRFASGHTLCFQDERRFGEVWLLQPGDPWPSRQPLGPDALRELEPLSFAALLRSATTRIQPLLMDQSRLAGVGNIYAQEALFKAGIRPTHKAYRLTRADSTRLFRALQETLQMAIDNRGSTSRNYRDGYGRRGAAQALHAVYRKGGQPCVRCSMGLKAIRIGGRGSVYCPACQK